MSRVRIGIVLGSTRDNRFTDVPATWVSEAAAKRESLDVEVLDHLLVTSPDEARPRLGLG